MAQQPTSTANPLPIDERNAVRFLAQQERDRGPGGLLLVRQDEWAYALPHEWPAPLANRLQETLDADESRSYFVVVLNAAACQIQVFSLDKRRAMMWLEEDNVVQSREVEDQDRNASRIEEVN